MNKPVAFFFLLAAQGEEPSALKDSLSVHTVERGNMPVRAAAHRYDCFASAIDGYLPLGS